MRKGRWSLGAGLGMALLLSVNGARAQDLFPAPGNEGRPDSTTLIQHESLPQPSGHAEEHNGHKHEEPAHHVEAEEEETGGLYVIADYLLVRPRRRALRACSTPTTARAQSRWR